MEQAKRTAEEEAKKKAGHGLQRPARRPYAPPTPPSFGDQVEEFLGDTVVASIAGVAAGVANAADWVGNKLQNRTVSEKNLSYKPELRDEMEAGLALRAFLAELLAKGDIDTQLFQAQIPTTENTVQASLDLLLYTAVPYINAAVNRVNAHYYTGHIPVDQVEEVAAEMDARAWERTIAQHYGEPVDHEYTGDYETDVERAKVKAQNDLLDALFLRAPALEFDVSGVVPRNNVKPFPIAIAQSRPMEEKVGWNLDLAEGPTALLFVSRDATTRHEFFTQVARSADLYNTYHTPGTRPDPIFLRTHVSAGTRGIDDYQGVKTLHREKRQKTADPAVVTQALATRDLLIALNNRITLWKDGNDEDPHHDLVIIEDLYGFIDTMEQLAAAGKNNVEAGEAAMRIDHVVASGHPNIHVMAGVREVPQEENDAAALGMFPIRFRADDMRLPHTFVMVDEETGEEHTFWMPKVATTADIG